MSSKEDVKALIIGIVAGLVVNFILQVFNFAYQLYLPVNISTVLWFIIPIFLGLIYLAVAHYVRKQQEENMPTVFATKEPPEIVLASYDINYFGVRWKVKIGTLGLPNLSNPYAVAYGPYCPKCGYKLDPYVKYSFFGWKNKYYWRCEPCNKLYRRPDKTLLREEDVVEKISMNEFRKQMKKNMNDR